jgi:hypothetical protein
MSEPKNTPVPAPREYRRPFPYRSDTPRTDALIFPNGCLSTHLLEHARQLERELNALKNKCTF